MRVIINSTCSDCVIVDHVSPSRVSLCVTCTWLFKLKHIRSYKYVCKFIVGNVEYILTTEIVFHKNGIRTPHKWCGIFMVLGRVLALVTAILYPRRRRAQGSLYKGFQTQLHFSLSFMPGCILPHPQRRPLSAVSEPMCLWPSWPDCLFPEIPRIRRGWLLFLPVKPLLTLASSVECVKNAELNRSALMDELFPPKKFPSGSKLRNTVSCFSWGSVLALYPFSSSEAIWPLGCTFCNLSNGCVVLGAKEEGGKCLSLPGHTKAHTVAGSELGSGLWWAHWQPG